jgi:hypothetical protein
MKSAGFFLFEILKHAIIYPLVRTSSKGTIQLMVNPVISFDGQNDEDGMAQRKAFSKKEQHSQCVTQSRNAAKRQMKASTFNLIPNSTMLLLKSTPRQSGAAFNCKSLTSSVWVNRRYKESGGRLSAVQ